jgi:hypothetical protein
MYLILIAQLHEVTRGSEEDNQNDLSDKHGRRELIDERVSPRPLRSRDAFVISHFGLVAGVHHNLRERRRVK